MEYFACVLLTTVVWGIVGAVSGEDFGNFMLLVGVAMLVVYISMRAGQMFL